MSIKLIDFSERKVYYRNGRQVGFMYNGRLITIGASPQTLGVPAPSLREVSKAIELLVAAPPDKLCRMSKWGCNGDSGRDILIGIISPDGHPDWEINDLWLFFQVTNKDWEKCFQDIKEALASLRPKKRNKVKSE